MCATPFAPPPLNTIATFLRGSACITRSGVQNKSNTRIHLFIANSVDLFVS